MAKDKRATEDVLAALHGAIAKELINRIASGEATPAELNAAIKFLKDNGIDCVGKENPDIMDLTKNLPVYDDPSEDMKLMN